MTPCSHHRHRYLFADLNFVSRVPPMSKSIIQFRQTCKPGSVSRPPALFQLDHDAWSKERFDARGNVASGGQGPNAMLTVSAIAKIDG